MGERRDDDDQTFFGNPSRVKAVVAAVLLVGAGLAAAFVVLTLGPDDEVEAVDMETVAAALQARALAFEPNMGQAPWDVRMVAAGDRYVLSLGDGVVVMGFPGTGKAVTMRFVGSSAAPAGDQLLEGRVNYLRSNLPERWVTEVPTYRHAVYPDAWPGISAKLYGTASGSPEYDFTVQPGASPDTIRLRFDGGSAPAILEDGSLQVALGDESVVHAPPVAYQDAGRGRAHLVDARFVIHGDGTVGFDVGAYDRARPLVIDPVVKYSTFIGGDQNDFSRDIAVDSAGFAYVVGETNSFNYPTTAGVFDTAGDSNKDVLVTKLNQTGTGLIYSTYLGGTSEDSGFGIGVDSGGFAYVTGFTKSSGFPTTMGAHDTVMSGGEDAFVTKLNLTGSGLVYSTFFGGGDEERGFALDVEPFTGRAHITGRTKSNTSQGFVVTSNAADAGHDGGFDAFYAVFNATGTGAPVYSTYLGGPSDDEGFAVDAQGFITGYTNSATGVEINSIFATPFDSTHNGNRDVFVIKINFLAATSTIARGGGTYLGGASDDIGYGIAEFDNNIFITGSTTSTTGAASTRYPTTVGAFDTTPNGNTEVFVSRLVANSSSLVWSTFLGGGAVEEGFAIDVDSRGVSVAGYTASSDFPLFDPFQGRQNGDDAFVTTLKLDGTALLFSTYLGGKNGTDRAHGIALDIVGDIYVTGHTTSNDYPTFPKPGAFDTVWNGNNDVFVTKFGTPIADLALTKEGSPSSARPGVPIVYFVNVTNLGPENATNVSVLDILPASFMFIAANTSKGTCMHAMGNVTCSIGRLNVSETVFINITAKGTQTGFFVNIAAVNTTAMDPTPGNDFDTELTQIRGEADISLTKFDFPDPVFEGTPLVYILNITNHGPDNATNVTVNDTLPPSVVLTNVSSSQGTCMGVPGNFVECSLGNISVNQTVIVTITVEPQQPGMILNTARTLSETFDPFTVNNSDAEPTTVISLADLNITKTDSPDPVTVNGTLTYTINVTNMGPSRAENVTVNDSLPEGMIFQGAITTQGTCANMSFTVICDLGTLGPNESAEIEIEVQATKVGVFVNFANVTADEPDPDGMNNMTTEETTVVPMAAGISITKEDGHEPVIQGENITYFVNVSNGGPGPATDVTVNDTLPAGTTFLNATATQGSCSSSPPFVECALGTLGSGESAQITIWVRADVAGNVTNFVNVTANENDPDPSDNSANESTEVIAPVADLNVTKTDSPDPVLVGGNLTFNITVVNQGPQNATNVTLVDVIEPNVVFVNATPDQGMCMSAPHMSGIAVTCDLGTIPAGGTVNVTIVVQPQQPGVVTDIVNVTSDQRDDDPDDNEDTTTTNVIMPEPPRADLGIIKDDSDDPVLVGQTFEYTLFVTNAGPESAPNVTVVDNVPASFTIGDVSTTTGGCITAGQVVTCMLGTLAANASAIITIEVTPTAPGVFLNTAVVAGAIEDPDDGNNTAVETTTVLSPNVPPPPPTGLECVARDDGNFLDWEASPGATSYNVFRAEGNGPFVLIDNVTDSEFLDENVTQGVVYRYRITAVNAFGESAPSEECSVTAIPFFPAWVLVALGAIGAVGAYAVARRWKP